MIDLQNDPSADAAHVRATIARDVLVVNERGVVSHGPDEMLLPPASPIMQVRVSQDDVALRAIGDGVVAFVGAGDPTIEGFGYWIVFEREAGQVTALRVVEHPGVEYTATRVSAPAPAPAVDRAR